MIERNHKAEFTNAVILRQIVITLRIRCFLITSTRIIIIIIVLLRYQCGQRFYRTRTAYGRLLILLKRSRDAFGWTFNGDWNIVNTSRRRLETNEDDHRLFSRCSLPVRANRRASWSAARRMNEDMSRMTMTTRWYRRSAC
jgi:hypothetical protein